MHYFFTTFLFDRKNKFSKCLACEVACAVTQLRCSVAELEKKEHKNQYLKIVFLKISSDSFEEKEFALVLFTDDGSLYRFSEPKGGGDGPHIKQNPRRGVLSFLDDSHPRIL